MNCLNVFACCTNMKSNELDENLDFKCFQQKNKNDYFALNFLNQNVFSDFLLKLVIKV